MEILTKELKCGSVYKHSENAVVLKIFVFRDIINKIIPLFNKYHIIGVKYKDYRDFILVADMMLKKEHLTEEGINKIIKIKMNMNSNKAKSWV
jgi:hypothetical protein